MVLGTWCTLYETLVLFVVRCFQLLFATATLKEKMRRGLRLYMYFLNELIEATPLYSCMKRCETSTIQKSTTEKCKMNRTKRKRIAPQKYLWNRKTCSPKTTKYTVYLRNVYVCVPMDFSARFGVNVYCIYMCVRL